MKPGPTIFELYTLAKSEHARHILDLLRQFPHHEGEVVLPPMPKIKAVACQGGGGKGVVYMGGMNVLEEEGLLEDIEFFAGASTGAITTLGFGLGFNSHHYKELTDNINFLDFFDVRSDGWAKNFGKLGIAADAIQHGAAYKGQTFHDLISFLIEHVLGDPFATYRDLHRARQFDPTLGDMIVKASRFQAKPGEKTEQTFSYETTPDVVLADAKRASMAYPTAFTPWEVRYWDNATRSLQAFGIFADGGIDNNNPIDALDSKVYADKQYPFVEREDQQGHIRHVNPCTLTLSLPSLEELDHGMTPFSPLIREMLANKKKGPASASAGAAAAPDPLLDRDPGFFQYRDLIRAARVSFIGQLVKQDVHGKLKSRYHDKNVQMWPDGVDTFDFNLDPQRRARMIAFGESAMREWLKKYRDPKLAYREAFNEDITREELAELEKSPEAYYFRKAQGYFADFIQEMERLSKYKPLSNPDVLSNVRLKFLAHRLNEIAQRFPHLIPRAFEHAQQAYLQRKQQIEEQRSKRFALLNPDLLRMKVIAEINTMINAPDELSRTQQRNRVIRILKGQMCNVIHFVQEPTLWHKIMTCPDKPFQDQVFKVLDAAATQLRLQKRLPPECEHFLTKAFSSAKAKA